MSKDLSMLSFESRYGTSMADVQALDLKLREANDRTKVVAEFSMPKLNERKFNDFDLNKDGGINLAELREMRGKDPLVGGSCFLSI